MSEQLPPDWAIERALIPVLPTLSEQNLTSWTVSEVKNGCKEGLGYCVLVVAFARYIAEHEEPPVDPLLLEAREIAASLAGDAAYHRNWADNVRAGKYDAEDRVQGALAALKRGIEIGKGQQ